MEGQACRAGCGYRVHSVRGVSKQYCCRRCGQCSNGTEPKDPRMRMLRHGVLCEHVVHSSGLVDKDALAANLALIKEAK